MSWCSSWRKKGCVDKNKLDASNWTCCSIKKKQKCSGNTSGKTFTVNMPKHPAKQWCIHNQFSYATKWVTGTWIICISPCPSPLFFFNHSTKCISQVSAILSFLSNSCIYIRLAKHCATLLVGPTMDSIDSTLTFCTVFKSYLKSYPYERERTWKGGRLRVKHHFGLCITYKPS